MRDRQAPTFVRPADIEAQSFAIISAELGPHDFDPLTELVVKRVIHTTTDFSYADLLYFSPDAVRLAKEALKGGAAVVTDTQMALAGVNKRSLERLGGQAVCYMSDPEVAAEAGRLGCTRARCSMDFAPGMA